MQENQTKAPEGPPMVSVIMLTYNGASFLEEQIESILSQTYKRFELIIADDGSTDASLEIAGRYAAGDARVRILASGENRGVNRNLERALYEDLAEFVAIADQDDIWEPDKLDVLLANIGNAAAIYSDSALVDEQGKSLGVTLIQRMKLSHPARGGGSGLVILRRNCVSGHALLFRSSLVRYILPIVDGLMYDIQLAVEAMIHGGLEFVERPLVRHRMHASNQTNSGLSGRKRSRTRELSEDGESIRALRHRALYERIGIMCKKLSDRTDAESIKALSRMTEIYIRSDRFDRYFFDFRMFMTIFKNRAGFYFPGEKGVVIKSIKYSLGLRYYRIKASLKVGLD